MSARNATSTAVLAAILIGIGNLGAQREVAAQPSTGLKLIRAVDVSSDILRVTVEYMYRGELPPGGVRLHVTPQEAGGIFDPRTVFFDELPVRPGVFTTTLMIAKRAGARAFTSVALRVCLSGSESAIACEDFPHQKQWATPASTPTPVPQPPAPPSSPSPPAPTPVPTPPPQPQTCSISGHVRGRLVMNLGPDHPGGVPESIELRHIVATKPDGTTIRTAIKLRRFVFTGLPAGVVYKLSAGTVFRSSPASIAVRCKAGARHNANFRIL